MDLAAPNRAHLATLEAPPARAELLDAAVSISYAGRTVLNGARLEIRQGEIAGLVGLSGSGKSTLGLALLGLLSLRGGKAEGHVRFEGRDLLRLREAEWRHIRGRQIAFVPQSPLASLNPALTIGAQFHEAWRAHAGRADGMPRILELLDAVQLPSTSQFLRHYPAQLSVGMAQRVLIAMAALHRPRLIIADEPTSALDVLTQAGILRVFQSLNQSSGTALLYISHDLLSVSSLCHQIAILREGRIVETGTPSQIFTAPRHEHTQSLVAAIPSLPARS